MKNIITFLAVILISGGLGIPSSLCGQNIYWIDSNFDAPRLVKTGVNGSELLSKPLTAGSQPQMLVLDAEHGLLLWNELGFNNAGIQSIAAGFGPVSTLLDSQSVLRGMAVDPVHNHLYWTTTNLDSGPKIWRAARNGESQTVLIDFGKGSNTVPRAISLDIDNGKMYWTNFGEGKIQRAEMVAGAIPEDVITGLQGPSGLAVEPASGKLFWTEMSGNQIKSADLDGGNVMLLVDGLYAPNFLSVNAHLNRMAWTEMGSAMVKSSALDGSGIITYDVDAVAPAGIVLESPQIPGGKLHVFPADTTIQVQNAVQFQSQLIDSLGFVYDVEAEWSVKRDHVGPISDDGRLFAYFPGKAHIMAKRDTSAVKTSLTVIDTTVDESGINTVKILRKFPNDRLQNRKMLKEGQKFTLGGLPHRLNILNGMAVYFPKGSLHENITVEVALPKLANIRADSLIFADEIINGITFNVYVNDSLVNPYYFDKPVSIAFPFKRGILKRYGIRISDLGLYFATDSLAYDSLGISQVVVDSSTNRIYGLVEHFSTLVVKESVDATSVEAGETVRPLPETFALEQNFPNPFNPTTSILYSLSTASEVELNIYNTVGQRIHTFVRGMQAPGQYTIEWDAGDMPSGIYFYQLIAQSRKTEAETQKAFIKTMKMVLLK